MTYKPTIGLEIHAEVNTESKMFCGCKNDPHSGTPNTHVCPVCMGYPGAMPFANERAIEQVLLLGAALHGELADESHFDRKHYFYPDIPKGYQITQHTHPLVTKASLLDFDISHIHLEEDTARIAVNKNANNITLDFNRAGVPLLELVTEPTMHSADDAVRFARELQRVLWATGVSKARMERGEMRVEANVSVSDTDTLGTKVEVKNLNSFKIVRDAINHEIQRHCDALEKGETIEQQTRGFDESKGITVAQRSKESSPEYRYAPEPDLPPFKVSLNPKWSLENLKKQLPELPEEKREKWRKTWKLSDEQIETILMNDKRQELFEKTVEGMTDETVRLAVNYLTNDIASYEEEAGDALYERITSSVFRDVIELIEAGKISSRGAKNIVSIIAKEGGMPTEIAEREGLFQQSDTAVLEKIAQEAIENHPSVVEDFKKGKDTAAQFFVGQVMKATKGSANPKETMKIILSILNKK